LELDPQQLLVCITDRWLPRIGDPSTMGWVTVFAYFGAAFLALVVGLRLKGREKLFWLLLTALLILLGINKQLDLQSALTAAGRCVSQAQGWYDRRAPFQFGVILAILATGVVSMGALVWWFRHHILKNAVALLGLAAIVTFVAVRAVGFHHIDQFINFNPNGIRMNWVMELGGIGLIASGALLRLALGRDTSSSGRNREAGIHG